MIKSNDLRRGRTCVFKMHVHLVFVTKYRRKLFSKSAMKDLNEIFSSVCNDFEAILKECDGENDHVHLLIEYHPKISVSKIVNSLKGVSSRLLRQKYPKIKKYLWKGTLWSPSYFAASCGGAPLLVIKDYIQKQSSPKN
jgi:putative transposase